MEFFYYIGWFLAGACLVPVLLVFSFGIASFFIDFRK